MTDRPDNATDRARTGAVEQLARDDVERKRFLKMAGRRMGAGAAATGLAAFIAACGSSNSSSSSSSGAAGAGSSGSGASSSTTSGNSSSSGTSAMSVDLGIVNYALTLEYLESQFYAKVIASGMFKGTTLSTIKTFGAAGSSSSPTRWRTSASAPTTAPDRR